MEDIQLRMFSLSVDRAHDLKTRFYAFVPSEKGPWSFTLAHELVQLETRGHIQRGAKELLQAKGPGVGELRLSKPIQRVVENSFWLNARHSYTELFKRLVESHPSMFPESKKIDADEQLEILTIGYEKASIEELLVTLSENGVDCLIDVRRNPVSRRYGFHKSTLQLLAKSIHIDYYHFPEVGISSNTRQKVNSTDEVLEMLRNYEQETLPVLEDALDAIASMCSRNRCALLCSELDPSLCHRTPLARSIGAITHQSIKHLVPLNEPK